MAYKFDKSGKVLPPTTAEIAAADADSFIIVKDQGILKNGKPYWVYLKVLPSKYEAFMQDAKAHKTIRHKEYGTIVKRGFDKEIPNAVKEEMARKYGCDDDYANTLAKKLKDARTKFDKQQEDKRLGDIVAMLKMKQKK